MLRGFGAGVLAMDQSLPRYIKWLTSSASTPGKITKSTTPMNTQATDPVVGSCCAYIGRACDIVASRQPKTAPGPGDPSAEDKQKALRPST